MSESTDHREEADEYRTAAIEALTEQLQVVEDVLDEIRTELQWHNNNVRGEIFHLTSMSLDPAAKDMRLNAVPKETVQRLQKDLF